MVSPVQTDGAHGPEIPLHNSGMSWGVSLRGGGDGGGGEDWSAFTRADLHCHSSASSGPAVRALGWIGVPECYSEPERVYAQARSRGMDLVAITDHDTIAGAMSLVERRFPGVIVGEEVTVYFPEDRCKLHVLVWGLTPELHDEIGANNLREDVYAFAAWLHQRNLAHALAHPLYQQSKNLSRWHIERCALLFKGFEVLNGAHAGTQRGALEAYLSHLTPLKVLKLVKDHGMEPLWPRVWEKARTGGSDDHGLLNVGRTWTAVPGMAAGPGSLTREVRKVLEPVEFLKHVMATRCVVGGVAGHSSLLAHQLTTVGANYVARRFFAGEKGKVRAKKNPRAQAVAAKLLRFAGVEVPAPSKAALVWDHLKRKVSLRRKPKSSPLLSAMIRAIGPVLDSYPELKASLKAERWLEGTALAHHERMAEFFDDLYAAVHHEMLDSAGRAVRGRDLKKVKDHLAGYLILELAQLPYLFSLFHQNKERAFVEQMQHDQAELSSDKEHRPMRVALFTDTLGDVNGVSRFIRDINAQAPQCGRDLHVFTSTRFVVPQSPTIHNFDPIVAGRMPKYENLEYVIPPVVKMLRAIDKHQPDVIHISTPGPVGFVGYLAARMLNVPVVGVYHTDFPAYIDELFDDPMCSMVVRKAMTGFYKPFRAIFTRSRDYVDSLVELGIARERILPLKPGLDITAFDRRFRDTSIWPSYGCSEASVKAIYVGRVSLEKNMPLLTRMWKQASGRLRAMGLRAELVIVGDGPYRAEMERELHGTGARFLGFRYGQELANLYAASDFFVFPSVTDTLGQVVMESQASGLPVLVSDQGGPKEVTREGETGFVLRADDVGAWVEKIVMLVHDRELCKRMGATAHHAMQSMSIRHSFDHFWQVHVQAWKESIAARMSGVKPEVSGPRRIVRHIVAGKGERGNVGGGVAHVASNSAVSTPSVSIPGVSTPSGGVAHAE